MMWIKHLRNIENLLDDLRPVWIACFQCGRAINLMTKEARSGTTEAGYLTFECPACKVDLTENAINILGDERYRDISIKCLYVSMERLKGGNI